MPNIFFISDTHFGHASTFEKFKNDDGTPMRPFTSIEEMNETMIERWNEVVRPSDIVYHLGDVAVNKRHVSVIERTNGRRKLIEGNHDTHFRKQLEPYFESSHAMRVLEGLILTHIPLHTDSVERFGTNVHGHLHNNEVLEYLPNIDWDHDCSDPLVIIRPDPRYLCVSVEHTDYRPISLEEVRQRIAVRQQTADYTPPKSWGNGSGPA